MLKKNDRDDGLLMRWMEMFVRQMPRAPRGRRAPQPPRRKMSAFDLKRRSVSMRAGDTMRVPKGRPR